MVQVGLDRVSILDTPFPHFSSRLFLVEGEQQQVWAARGWQGRSGWAGGGGGGGSGSGG